MHGVSPASQGEIARIIGANGAGKSTLQRIAGLKKPSGGAVVFEGKKLDIAPHKIVGLGSFWSLKADAFSPTCPCSATCLSAFLTKKSEMDANIEKVLELFPVCVKGSNRWAAPCQAESSRCLLWRER